MDLVAKNQFMARNVGKKPISNLALDVFSEIGIKYRENTKFV